MIKLFEVFFYLAIWVPYGMGSFLLWTNMPCMNMVVYSGAIFIMSSLSFSSPHFCLSHVFPCEREKRCFFFSFSRRMIVYQIKKKNNLRLTYIYAHFTFCFPIYYRITRFINTNSCATFIFPAEVLRERRITEKRSECHSAIAWYYQVYYYYFYYYLVVLAHGVHDYLVVAIP